MLHNNFTEYESLNNLIFIQCSSQGQTSCQVRRPFFAYNYIEFYIHCWIWQLKEQIHEFKRAYCLLKVEPKGTLAHEALALDSIVEFRGKILNFNRGFSAQFSYLQIAKSHEIFSHRMQPRLSSQIKPTHAGEL